MASYPTDSLQQSAWESKAIGQTAKEKVCLCRLIGSLKRSTLLPYSLCSRIVCFAGFLPGRYPYADQTRPSFGVAVIVSDVGALIE
jgi:hypothetical protein